MTKPLFRRIASVVCVFLYGIVWSTGAHANQKPRIQPVFDQTVSVGETLELIVESIDPEGVVPSLNIISAPPGSSFVDNRNGTRTFRWSPTASDIGVRWVDFRSIDALDQALVDIKTIRVNVIDYATDPVISDGLNIEPISDQQVAVGQSIRVRVVPTKPNGVVPGLRISDLPEGASFVDNFDGTRNFQWTPRADQEGNYSLTVTAVDAQNNSRTATRNFQVVVGRGDPPSVQPPSPEPLPDNGNNIPQFNDIPDQIVYLGDSINILVAPRDDDRDVPGLFLDRLPQRASFNDNRDGTRTLSWQPYPIDLGDTWITFTAVDARDPSLRVEKSVRITVGINPDPNVVVNFSPVINGIKNPVIRVGDTLNMKVEPVDPDFDVPELSVLNPPEGAEFVDGGNGTRTLIWPTDANDLGETSVTFQTRDIRNSSLQDEKTVTIRVVEPSSLNRSGDRLRNLADRRDFLFGYAAILEASNIADTELYRDIAREEFNIVTPENSMKWGWIQPSRNLFRWEDADELADYARDNNMVLHGHPLIWHRQLPGWVQASPLAEVESIMIEHITQLTARYAGEVKIWDVVNEALEEDGSFRNSIWQRAMGSDYIAKSFRQARNVDPSSILIYNDYDVAWKNPKSDAMYELLRRELERGTPIDGVGFQMHLWTEFDQYQSLIDNLQRFADLGLAIYITEFDVSMEGPDQLGLQTEVYRRITEICLRQPACKAMQMWGFTDRYSWRSENTPLIFDEDYLPKPAYFELQRVLREFR